MRLTGGSGLSLSRKGVMRFIVYRLLKGPYRACGKVGGPVVSLQGSCSEWDGGVE